VLLGVGPSAPSFAKTIKLKIKLTASMPVLAYKMDAPVEYALSLLTLGALNGNVNDCKTNYPSHVSVSNESIMYAVSQGTMILLFII
jgi:hypothetical protein